MQKPDKIPGIYRSCDAGLFSSQSEDVGLTLCHPSVMIRKQEVLDAGGYRNKMQFAENFDLWLRLAEKGKLANLPDVLIKYRQHLSSIGYTNRAKQLHSHKMALLDAFNHRKLEMPDWLPLMDQQVLVSQLTEADHRRKWALQCGYINQRENCDTGVKKKPFEIENWRAFVCVMRGR